MLALKCKYTWILSIFSHQNRCVYRYIYIYILLMCVYYIYMHMVYISLRVRYEYVFVQTIMQQYVGGNLDFTSYPSRC